MGLLEKFRKNSLHLFIPLTLSFNNILSPDFHFQFFIFSPSLDSRSAKLARDNKKFL